LENNVKFVNKFLTDDELGEYLNMQTFISVLIPNRDQAVSGTMAFALGCGLAVVSTDYAFAKEVLGNGRGLLAKTNDPHELAVLINRIIEDKNLQNILRNKASTLGKTLAWPATGQKYLFLFDKILKAYKTIS
jgi:glycosyltransferase involved in cell wall biosynthesis